MRLVSQPAGAPSLGVVTQPDAPAHRRNTRPRRRDRRGRGLRGPLAPSGVPLALSRSEQFDELVLHSLRRLESAWGATLDAIEVIVADAPDVPDPGLSDERVPLGRADPASGDQPARIVVHRRPVEARARGRRAREDLVHAVVVEQLAKLLGLDPDTVDPEAAHDEDPDD